MTDTFLLVGFGNPGREYKDTRHNIGFMFIDRVAVALNARGMKLQSKAIVLSALYEERKVILAKPQTYMNLSGQSVQGLLHFYKLPPENLLVAHDDLDLPFGTLRIRPAGGPKEFPRLRLGIGRPPGRMDPKDYVLQEFSRDDLKLLPEILDRAAEAALEFVIKGLNAAMNKYNGNLTNP